MLVRQKDNSVKAFYNVCHHRGNRLVHSFEKPLEAARHLAGTSRGMLSNYMVKMMKASLITYAKQLSQAHGENGVRVNVAAQFILMVVVGYD